MPSTISYRAKKLRQLLQTQDPGPEKMLSIPVIDLVQLCWEFEEGSFARFFNVVECSAENENRFRRCGN